MLIAVGLLTAVMDALGSRSSWLLPRMTAVCRPLAAVALTNGLASGDSHQWWV